ncbi:MAG: formate/nitrite transporter family protein [Opitutaceae bacterium]|jgi:formate transporter
MDNIRPNEVVKMMVETGAGKAALGAKDILIRGSLSGALLACATSLAFTASAQTNLPLVGAIIFPVGFVMIILLGLELVTGSFAIVPLGALEGHSRWGRVAGNLSMVFIANLLGSVAYGVLLYLALTQCGADAPAGIATKIAAAAEAKTLAYAAHGPAGFATAFVKGVLCNWLVCLGVVLPMTTSSMLGKVVGAWIPIMTFFAQGFEHSVVNMFIIPTGILFGAKVTVGSWWLWNQIPVTLGNLVGGLLFTGLFLYWTHSSPRTQPVGATAEDPSCEGAKA